MDLLERESLSWFCGMCAEGAVSAERAKSDYGVVDRYRQLGDRPGGDGERCGRRRS